MGELRRVLDGTPVWLVATYLAERMGCAKPGHFTIRLQVADGHWRRRVSGPSSPGLNPGAIIDDRAARY